MGRDNSITVNISADVKLLVKRRVAQEIGLTESTYVKRLIFADLGLTQPAHVPPSLQLPVNFATSEQFKQGVIGVLLSDEFQQALAGVKAKAAKGVPSRTSPARRG